MLLILIENKVFFHKRFNQGADTDADADTDTEKRLTGIALPILFYFDRTS